ncbi:enoyl-CoA hydratase/isomerase family protein [Xanthobacter sp. TB0139]|uniref:enoyl-CoA hydratase/isomerase family protein n=1 Tax=Xanthobacter sp. TB0139 TaxID=3459178 RepID=UPI004039D4B9
MTETQPVLSGINATRQGRAGIITLDRPAALNALDLPMVQGMMHVLTQWADDPGVDVVVVRSTHPKAFCAGGDIRAIRAASLEGRFQDIHTFFASEYELNCLIGAYPKPYVALIDGYCMGGGMGISMHAPHRVVGEGVVLSMPETLIGFFPDVGATHFLPRLADGIGLYLALTGAHVKAADAMASGIATAFVPRAQHEALVEALAKGEPVANAIAHHSAPAPAPSALAEARPLIAELFADAPSALSILQTLERTPGDFAAQTLKTLRGLSPTSLAITFENIRRGASLSLPDATALELFLSGPVTRSADFLEGVRAALVDKDRSPKWQPARLEEVEPATIAALYAGAPV